MYPLRLIPSKKGVLHAGNGPSFTRQKERAERRRDIIIRIANEEGRRDLDCGLVRKEVPPR